MLRESSRRGRSWPAWEKAQGCGRPCAHWILGPQHALCPPPHREKMSARHLGQLRGAGTARLRAQLTYQVPSVFRAGGEREMRRKFLRPQMGRGKLRLVHQNLACWSYRAPLERK